MKFNKNINYKHKALIGLSINLLIFLFISYFFVYLYFNKVSEANIKLINHRVEFSTKLIKEEKFSKITKKLSNIEKDLNKIEKSFISQNNKLEFITLFEGLSEANGVTMDMSIDFDKIIINKKIAPLNLSLTGSYKNLMSFLVSVENLNYYINIENISVSSSGGVANISPENNTLTMNIKALSYWK